MNHSVDPYQDSAIAAGLTATSPTPATLETWLVERLAACLSIDPNDIDPDAPFDSYGLDSAEAVGLSGELEDWLQQRVSPTLLYDYPTIAALSEHLGRAG